MAHKVIKKTGLGFFFWTLTLAFLEGCCDLPGYSLSLAFLRKLLTEPVWCFRFSLSIFEVNSQLYYFQEKWALKSVDTDAHNKQIIFPLLIFQPTMRHPPGGSNERTALAPSPPPADPPKRVPQSTRLQIEGNGRKTQRLTFLKRQICKYFQIYPVPGATRGSLF